MSALTGRITRLSVASLVTAAAATVALAAPAQAATPDYLCDTLTLVNLVPTGLGNCVPLNGAPATGPISGLFTIHARDLNKIMCGTEGGGVSGLALTPTSVTCLA